MKVGRIGRRVYPDRVNRDHKIAAFTIFGTLIAFKLATALYVLSLQPTFHAAAFLTLTSLVWFGLIAIPLLLFSGFWYRRIKVRRKRKQLIHAEWNVDEPVRMR